MRILLVNDCPIDSGHGTERHICALYNALKERGHTPFILTSQIRGKAPAFSEDSWLVPHLNAPPIRKRPLKNFKNLRDAIKIARHIIENIRPDVIHVHNLLNPFSLRALRKLRPVIKSIHDCRPFCVKPPPDVATRLVGISDRFCSRTFGLGCWSRCYIARKPKDLIEAWSYFPQNLLTLREVTKCDRLVVYSQYLQQFAMRKMYNSEKIELMSHFYDSGAIDSNELTIPSAKRLLFVGRLSYEKGLTHLLEAISRLPRDFETVIVGDGPMKEHLQGAIQNMNGRNIRLLGYLPYNETIKMYRESSLVVFPSIGSEGCGLVGIEALANGKPVVSYDVGGVNEWLIDGKTGFLVERGNIEQLAKKIQFLLCNEKIARQMGWHGIKLVNRKFRKDFHVNRLIGIYKDAIVQRQKSTLLRES